MIMRKFQVKWKNDFYEFKTLNVRSDKELLFSNEKVIKFILFFCLVGHSNKIQVFFF